MVVLRDGQAGLYREKCTLYMLRDILLLCFRTKNKLYSCKENLPLPSFPGSPHKQEQSEMLTTMRFHMRAASATRVETLLQPGIRMILMGSL